MRIKKHRYRDHTKQVRETKNFYLFFTDHLGRRERCLPLPAAFDKRLAETFGRHVQALVGHRMVNEQPSPEQTKWLENIPARTRKRLVALGLLDASRAAAGRPLTEHIEDFRQSILRRKKTTKHADETIHKVKDVVDGCGFTVWSDITADAVDRYLEELREGQRQLSQTSSNHYLTAMKAFCDWMVANKRASESPLDPLKRLTVSKSDQEHPRAALTVEEVERLLKATVKAPMSYGMSGYERALLYQFAIETGLRAGAIRSLTVSSINSDMGSVVLKDSNSKNRVQVVVPLRPSMVEELQAFTANRLPWVKLFGGSYNALTDKTSDMLQEDLAATAEKNTAGKVVLEAITYITANGEYHDFHAFRHTGYSWLESRGVPRQIISQIFGHKTLRMGDIYAHPDWEKMKEAVAKLPPLKIQDESAKTGTDGK